MLATPRRRAARLALQTRAVAHQREVRALGTGFADIALHARFGALLGDAGDALRRLGPAERRGRVVSLMRHFRRLA